MLDCYTMRADSWGMKTSHTVKEIAEENGWSVVQTGGGCDCLQKDGHGDAYAMITDGGDPSAPTNPNAACLLGFYDGENSEPIICFDCPNLATAMQIAEMKSDLFHY